MFHDFLRQRIAREHHIWEYIEARAAGRLASFRDPRSRTAIQNELDELENGSPFYEYLRAVTRGATRDPAEENVPSSSPPLPACDFYCVNSGGLLEKIQTSLNDHQSLNVRWVVRVQVDAHGPREPKVTIYVVRRMRGDAADVDHVGRRISLRTRAKSDKRRIFATTQQWISWRRHCTRFDAHDTILGQATDDKHLLRLGTQFDLKINQYKVTAQVEGLFGDRCFETNEGDADWGWAQVVFRVLGKEYTSWVHKDYLCKAATGNARDDEPIHLLPPPFDPMHYPANRFASPLDASSVTGRDASLCRRLEDGRKVVAFIPAGSPREILCCGTPSSDLPTDDFYKRTTTQWERTFDVVDRFLEQVEYTSRASLLQNPELFKDNGHGLSVLKNGVFLVEQHVVSSSSAAAAVDRRPLVAVDLEAVFEHLEGHGDKGLLVEMFTGSSGLGVEVVTRGARFEGRDKLLREKDEWTETNATDIEADVRATLHKHGVGHDGGMEPRQVLLWFGIPCWCWTGVQALLSRDANHPWGRTLGANATEEQRRFKEHERVANQQLRDMLGLIDRLLKDFPGIRFAIENGNDTYLWRALRTQDGWDVDEDGARSCRGFRFSRFDACRFAAPWRKRTRLLHNCEALDWGDEFNCACNWDAHNPQQRPFEHLDIRKLGGPRHSCHTAAYPTEFCRTVADRLCEFWEDT